MSKMLIDNSTCPQKHVLVSQVVYSGPLDAAAAYFKEVGFEPDQLRSNVADYMLDSVIRASDDDVADMVERFSRWAFTHKSTTHQAAGFWTPVSM